MWQLYGAGSLIAGAFENAADKAGIVHDGKVDSMVASFLRGLFFLIATLVVGATGLLGEMTFGWHWSYAPVAVTVVIGSMLFTYVLRTVEITTIGAIAYVAPFFYLIVDTYFLGETLTSVQVAGVFLLVSGALAFALDGRAHHFKKSFHLPVLGALLLIYIGFAGFEAYLFKHLHETYAITSVSYFAVTTAAAVALFFPLLLVSGKWKLLFTRHSRAYLPYAFVGKSFDVLNSILFMSALTFASVSQVGAFMALMPLAIFLVAALTQGAFGYGLHEHLRGGSARWKLGSAIVLVVGGFLVG